VIPVQAILPAALAALIRKSPLTDEKVAFAWRTAVGPAVAAATEVTLDQGVLRVRARDRAWQRELERSAATVRRRIDDLLGAGIVRALEFTAAAPSTAGPRQPAVAPPRATGPAAAARAQRSSPSAGGSSTGRRRR